MDTAPQSIVIGNAEEVCVSEAAAVACCKINELLMRGGIEEGGVEKKEGGKEEGKSGREERREERRKEREGREGGRRETREEGSEGVGWEGKVNE